MDRDDLQADGWRALNQDFHRRFYDCARSPHLLELISRVWDKVEPYIAIYACSVENFHEAHRQHLEILESIATRDLYSPSPSGRTGPQRGNSHLVNTHHYRLTTE